MPTRTRSSRASSWRSHKNTHTSSSLLAYSGTKGLVVPIRRGTRTLALDNPNADYPRSRQHLGMVSQEFGPVLVPEKSDRPARSELRSGEPPARWVLIWGGKRIFRGLRSRSNRQAGHQELAGHQPVSLRYRRSRSSWSTGTNSALGQISTRRARRRCRELGADRGIPGANFERPTAILPPASGR